MFWCFYSLCICYLAYSIEKCHRMPHSVSTFRSFQYPSPLSIIPLRSVSFKANSTCTCNWKHANGLSTLFLLHVFGASKAVQLGPSTCPYFLPLYISSISNCPGGSRRRIVGSKQQAIASGRHWHLLVSYFKCLAAGCLLTNLR